jgi:hypothetical protein
MMDNVDERESLLFSRAGHKHSHLIVSTTLAYLQVDGPISLFSTAFADTVSRHQWVFAASTRLMT